MINSLKDIRTILSSTYNTLLSFISLVSSIFKGKETSSPASPASSGGYDADREGSDSFSSSQKGCKVQCSPQNKVLDDDNNPGTRSSCPLFEN